MPLDDKTVIELADKLLAKATDSDRIATIENELKHAIDDIKEIKQQKKDEPKIMEAAKDKSFSKRFVIISCILGILGFVGKLWDIVTGILKKP